MLLSFQAQIVVTLLRTCLLGEILRASKIVSGTNAALARRTAAVDLLRVM
jgi:hypothetical protein